LRLAGGRSPRKKEMENKEKIKKEKKKKLIIDFKS